MSYRSHPQRPPFAFWLTVLLLCAVMFPRPTVGEESSPSRELRLVMSRLVPYDLDGVTLRALTELERLENALDPRVSSIAHFLRIAASVEILTYSVLTSDSEIRQELATALRTTSEELPLTLERLIQNGRARGFREHLASYQVILRCLGNPNERCSADLRRVADSGGSGATAARLLALAPVVRGVEQARRAAPAQAARPIVNVAGALCSAPRDASVRSACEEAHREGGNQNALARIIFTQAVDDVAALERARQGRDPLVTLAEDWVQSASERVGWLAFPQILNGDSFAGTNLPHARASTARAPFELLIIGSSATYVALTPTVAISPRGATRLDESTGLTMPGRVALHGPYRFRAVVRPIPEIIQALEQMKAAVDEVIETQGMNGPSWLTGDQRALGLVIDRDMIIADIGRFVMSARLAGYRRFAFFGRRADGSLTVLSATTGTLEEGPIPRDLPRLAISPRDVRFVDREGSSTQFQRSDPRLGRAVADRVNGHSLAFAVHATYTWMSYGLVFPTIDAVVSASHSSVSQYQFLLPP